MVMNPNLRVGFHISKQKTLLSSFERILGTPIQSCQIYVSSGRGYSPPAVNNASILDLRQTRAFFERNPIFACVHGCLLYNLAGSKDGPGSGKSDADVIAQEKFTNNLEKTIVGLVGELDHAAAFGSGVVVHTGTEKNKSRGMVQISKTIQEVLTRVTPNTKKIARDLDIPVSEFVASRQIFLENCAGEGTKLGANLDEISTIIESVNSDQRRQVGVCIDTCHGFAARMCDFGNPKSVKKFFSQFDEKIGLERLKVFHLNDSRTVYGSRRDVHENLGVGWCFNPDRKDGLDGFEGLAVLLDKCEELRIPVVGEPPSKTADKLPAPGGMWDYEIMRRVGRTEEPLNGVSIFRKSSSREEDEFECEG